MNCLKCETEATEVIYATWQCEACKLYNMRSANGYLEGTLKPDSSREYYNSYDAANNTGNILRLTFSDPDTHNTWESEAASDIPCTIEQLFTIDFCERALKLKAFA